jgi:hypothetical protein
VSTRFSSGYGKNNKRLPGKRMENLTPKHFLLPSIINFHQGEGPTAVSAEPAVPGVLPEAPETPETPISIPSSLPVSPVLVS